MTQHPHTIVIEIDLDTEEMSRPVDVAYLLLRLATAFQEPSWPVLRTLYDTRGRPIGQINFRYTPRVPQ